MKLQLFINKSEDIKVNKDIEFINEFTGNLRMPTTLLNPVIDIEISEYNSINSLLDVAYLNFITPTEYEYADISYVDDEEYEVDTYTNDTSLFNINYAYIEEFKRYYYIINMDIINNKLFRLYLKEDELNSLKDKFLPLNAFIERNEYYYNDLLEDKELPLNFYCDVSVTKMGGGTFKFNPSVSPLNANYMISVLNDTDLDTPVISGVENLPNVAYTSSGRNQFSNTYAMTWANVNKLARYIVDGHETDATYIISLIAYPFAIPLATGVEDNLIIGHNKSVTDTKVLQPQNTISPYNLVASAYIRGSSNSWLDKEPYTTYEIFLPYYDYVEVKSSDVLNKLINIYYAFDYSNGTARIIIYNATDKYVVKSVTANIGIKISVSRTNQQQLDDEKLQLGIKSAISGIASVASIGIGAVTENPYLIASGVSGIVGTATDVASTLATMHDKAQVSSNSSLEGLYGTQDVLIKKTRYTRLNVSDLDYRKFFGKPLNEFRKLNTLLGYTKITDIHLENIDALEDEKDNLKTLLINGIII